MELHLIGFETAKDWMSSTTKFKTDCEFLGTISSTMRSSTNFVYTSVETVYCTCELSCFVPGGAHFRA